MARTSFYARNYVGWPPVPLSEINNPDSRHWMDQSFAARDRLVRVIGEDAYLEWIEDVYPGNTINGATWKGLHDLYIEKLAEAQEQQA